MTRKRSPLKEGVPEIVVGRLPLYLRALSHLQGVREITSQSLGRMVGISAAQIRKDLSYFGDFGKQGAGYRVENLLQKLEGILQVDREWPVLLVGVGNLGEAIAGYGGFQHRGFRVAALFDIDPAKIGKRIGGLEVQDERHMPPVVREMGLKVAIIAVPAAAAQKVAEALVEAGIQSILNYAPVTLDVPAGVRVYHIDPVIGLQEMTYYLQERNSPSPS